MSVLTKRNNFNTRITVNNVSPHTYSENYHVVSFIQPYIWGLLLLPFKAAYVSINLYIIKSSKHSIIHTFHNPQGDNAQDGELTWWKPDPYLRDVRSKPPTPLNSQADMRKEESEPIQWTHDLPNYQWSGRAR